MRRKAAPKTDAPVSASAIALPRDLVYDDIAKATLCARTGLTHAMAVNASSLFNASRLDALLRAGAATSEQDPAVGNHLWLPESKCYATVIAVESQRNVTVLRYYSVAGSGGCSLHLADDTETCWRLVRPLCSEAILLQPGMICQEILVPRAGAPGSKLGLDKPWQRCYRVGSRASATALTAACSATEDLLAAAGAALLDLNGTEDAFTKLCADIYADVAIRRLQYTDANCAAAVPLSCPGVAAGNSPCHIIRKGWQPGPRVLSSEGVRMCLCQKYFCHTHAAGWNISATACALGGTSVAADAVGDFLVAGDFWPSALRLFEETECIEAVRRHITAATSDSMARALSSHPGVSFLRDSSVAWSCARVKLTW